MTGKEIYTTYYKNASVLHKLIIVNVIAFVLVRVLQTIGFLFNLNKQVISEMITSWFSFPKDLLELLYTPWTLITYSFLHDDFRHILFNMLFLYFFGQLFLNLNTGRRFLNVYFLGVISGAVAYTFAYNVFPAFANISRSILVGASAGVSAVMVAATLQRPDTPFKLMFIPITFKLWWLTVGLLVLDVVSIPNGNAGGHIAHLGGALIGYLFISQLKAGSDIGKPLEKTMDWLVSLTKPKDKVRMKTVHKTKNKSTIKKSRKWEKPANQKEVDIILDKISKSGYESLSKAEKDFLFKAGKN